MFITFVALFCNILSILVEKRKIICILLKETSFFVIFCAFFPDVIVFLSSIPKPVMGVILLYLMTTQLSSAFQLVVQDDALPNFNSCMTVAFPLMIALIISFMPAAVAESMPPVLRPLLANGFVMGVIAVLLMEHVIYRNNRR